MSRILVIDPEGSLLQGLRESPLLEEAELEGVPRQVEALHRLRLRSYDVVVTDPAVPADAGFTFLEQLREIRPGVRVILLSPAAAHGELIAALRSRVFATFTPPLDPEEIAAMVARAAESPGGEAGIEVVSARPDWLALRVNCGLVTVDRLVRFLTELGRDLATGERDRLLLGVRELLLNAMEHGAGFDPEKVIEIAAVRTARAVVFYIKDPGPGFDPTHLRHAVEPGADPTAHLGVREEEGRRPGGFGLHLARSVADELIHNERGNEVLLIKHTR